MGAVAVVAHTLIDDMSWQAAFVLGAIVAPTDPVAATAIFRRLGVPPHLTTRHRGREPAERRHRAGRLQHRRRGDRRRLATRCSTARVDLVLVSAGGVVIGLAVAWLVAQAHRRIEDATIEIAVTLLTPYVAFIAAEQLDTSGILAAVVSGLYLGWQSPEFFAPATRIQAWAFWEVSRLPARVAAVHPDRPPVPGRDRPALGHPAAELALYAAAVAVT